MPGCFKTYAARCLNICILARQIPAENSALKDLDNNAEAVASFEYKYRRASTPKDKF
jgi:hypothetical protein